MKVTVIPVLIGALSTITEWLLQGQEDMEIRWMDTIQTRALLRCCILTFDPATMPFQRRRECIFHWHERAWLTKWDKVKSRRTVIDWCTGRELTCELHDSYFRLMTIKHAIPKIEWAIGLLYNSVNTGSQLVLETRSWRQEVLEKARTQQSGPQASGWAALENEKDATLMAIRVEVNMLQFCSVSNSLSHTKLSNKVRGIFFKRSLRSSLFIASIYILHVYVYIFIFIIWLYNKGRQ